jgi:dTMP kinase
MEKNIVPGVFVVLEGPDLAGKSGLCVALHEHYGGIKGGIATRSREPGGTYIAEKLREIVKSKDTAFEGEPMHPFTQACLHIAARHQHVREVIKPMLELGRHVFCDRFTDSTMAYQGIGLGVNQDTLRYMNGVAVEGTTPDLVIILDADPRALISRKDQPEEGRDNFEADRYDGIDLDIKDRQRAHYLSLAEAQPHRYVVIDALLSREEVFAKALSEVTALIQRKAQ